MNLTYLYMQRMLKRLFKKQSLITLISLLATMIGISLIPMSILPFTPSTRRSLEQLASGYFNLPVNAHSIAVAYFAILFPLLVILFASLIVSDVPEKVILYERNSGNMEILLSSYSDMRKIAQALMVSSLVLSAVVYLIFTASGIVTILGYEAIYHQRLAFPPVFYMFLFVIGPIFIVLSVTLSLLFTITVPALSSIETHTLSSSPLQIIADLPSIVLILIITTIPLSLQILAMYTVPAAAILLGLTLFFAKKTMRRDVLVRK